MNTSISSNDEVERIESKPGPSQYSERDSRASYEVNEPRYELGLWLRAVRSFFDARNHPFPDAEQSAVLTRDWANELVIARQTVLRVSQLTLRMVHLEGSASAGGETVEDQENVERTAETEHGDGSGQVRLQLVDLAEAMGDVASVCETLLGAPRVGFHAWSTVGKVLARELDRSDIARKILRDSYRNAGLKLPAVLLGQTQKVNTANENGADIAGVVSDLARLLQRLRVVDVCLQRDQPLKQTLPVFCLIYEESRALLEFIDSRVLSAGDVERPDFEALDGMNYAIAMELRKVFARELVGLASLRESPSIYARVENAHGLLRDCFQQSLVGVAQLLDPALDVSQLFDTFQTRLEQSLTLRKDLWTLLQLVRRAEQERDRHPISRLIELLNSFREGSLRYLMYKDWEACERFMEEVAAARGAVEVTPVVHRFSAYLETLLGQVNMRSVLLDHAFDYGASES